MTDALIIGAGPAGLMAAEHLAARGVSVIVAEAKPSVARKFLMAGKSGLNLTKNEPLERVIAAYAEAGEALRPMLAEFGPQKVIDWAEGLGQEMFTGSTGRVFPRAMKASPLLRAWLARLADSGVEIRTRHRFTRLDGETWHFETPDGPWAVRADMVVLAMGGASWARLGSDGAWAAPMAAAGVDLAPFAPANAAINVAWSSHMERVFGAPLKAISLRAGAYHGRGEAVISARGLEGGGVYAISRGVREGAPVFVDLKPDLSCDDIARRLAKPRGKASLATHLRKQLRLEGGAWALLNECARPLPKAPQDLAALIKSVPLRHDGLRPMDEAISTAGGVRFQCLNQSLMLRKMPNVYCVGEMVDWEAPTGGYLLTACLAMGAWVGRHAPIA